MKLRVQALVSVAIVLAVSVGISGFSHFLIFDPADSPIDIGGGSIYGEAGVFNWWDSLNDETIWGATSTDKNYLVLHGLVDAQNNPAPSTLTNTGPWLVFIATAYPPGTPPASISFCSDSVMPSGFPLQASTQYCSSPTSSSGTVYVQANGYARWEKRLEILRLKKRLHFHNRQQNCDGDTGNGESGCDQIAAVMVTVSNDASHVNGVSYHCKDEKDCFVQSGH